MRLIEVNFYLKDYNMEEHQYQCLYHGKGLLNLGNVFTLREVDKDLCGLDNMYSVLLASGEEMMVQIIEPSILTELTINTI